MASNPTHLNTTVDGANGLTSKTSGSISPSAGAFLVVALATAAQGVISFNVGTVTTTLANVGPWTVHRSVTGQAVNSYGVAIATAQITGSPGSGTVTVTWTGTSTRTVLTIAEVVVSTPPSVPQSGQATGTASTLAVPLSATGASSLVIGAINSRGASAIAAGSGFTELVETSSTGGGNSQLQLQYDNGGSITSCGWSGLGATNDVGAAIEISEDTEGTPQSLLLGMTQRFSASLLLTIGQRQVPSGGGRWTRRYPLLGRFLR